jgi:hypothetical protein
MQRTALGVVAAGCLLTATVAHAQNGGAASAIDPEAMAALDRMGTYLRSLGPFRVRAVVTTEQVLEDGQKVELTRAVDLLAVRPNRLRVEIDSDRGGRTLLYDGSSFTLWAPRLKYYATVPAPQSIAQLVTELEDRYDIEVPLIDLFRWGTVEAPAAAITAARDLGPAQIDGTTCQHYAFRQDGLDWQVWIQNGDFPLPRRLVLTTLTDEARPQHTAAYTWDLAPSYNDAAFAFTPSADAKRITLAEVAALRAAERKETP